MSRISGGRKLLRSLAGLEEELELEKGEPSIQGAERSGTVVTQAPGGVLVPRETETLQNLLSVRREVSEAQHLLETHDVSSRLFFFFFFFMFDPRACPGSKERNSESTNLSHENNGFQSSQSVVCGKALFTLEHRDNRSYPIKTKLINGVYNETNLVQLKRTSS